MPEVERIGDQPDKHHRATGEAFADDGEPVSVPFSGGPAIRPDDGGRAQCRRERAGPGERRGMAIGECRRGNRRDAQRGHRFPCPAGHAPCPVREACQQAARQQFPRPRRQPIERHGAVPWRGVHRDAQAGGRGDAEHRRQPRPGTAAHPPRAQQQDCRRKQHVELLLHRQGPRVQQGKFLGGLAEILRVGREIVVGHRHGLRRRGSRHADVLVGVQQPPASRERRGHHDHRRRHDAPNPAFPESAQGERAPLAFPQDQSRDHEEHVDADIAAVGRESRVEKDHGKHCHGAQSVHVGSVVVRRRSGWCRGFCHRGGNFHRHGFEVERQIGSRATAGKSRLGTSAACLPRGALWDCGGKAFGRPRHR